MSDLNKRFKLLQMLSSVRRYSQFHLVKPESVLEHTASVSFLVDLITSDIESLDCFLKDKIAIDYKRLLKSVIYHDIDEIVTGDIPRTTKYADADILNKFKELERQSMRLLVLDYELPEGIYNIWENSKSGFEGDILKLADIISVVYKVWEEVKIYNNNSMLLVGNQVASFLMQYKQVLESREYSAIYKDYFINYIKVCEDLLKDIMC